MGAAATVVNGTVMGKSASRERISVRRVMVASARVASSVAKWSPMQEADRVLDCYARKKHTPGPENRVLAFDVSMVW